MQILYNSNSSGGGNNKLLTFIEHFLCSRHGGKHLAFIISSNGERGRKKKWSKQIMWSWKEKEKPVTT